MKDPKNIPPCRSCEVRHCSTLEHSMPRSRETRTVTLSLWDNFRAVSAHRHLLSLFLCSSRALPRESSFLCLSQVLHGRTSFGCPCCPCRAEAGVKIRRCSTCSPDHVELAPRSNRPLSAGCRRLGNPLVVDNAWVRLLIFFCISLFYASCLVCTAENRGVWGTASTPSAFGSPTRR